MTFSAFTARGTATEKVSDTSLGISPSAAITVGKIAFLIFGLDNLADTDDTDTAHVSVTDDVGNTWVVAKEHTCSPTGAAAVGAIAGVAWALVETEIGTGATVTLTVDSAVTVKLLGIAEVTVGAGNTVQVVGTLGSHTHSGGGFDSGILSGLDNVEHLWIGVHVKEVPFSSTVAQDTTYTDIFGANIGVSGNPAASNQVMRPQYRIFTSTSDQYNGGGGTASDASTILVAFEEVAGLADTDVEISAAELRVPDATDVEISAIELRIPDAASDVEISAIEFRIPTAETDVEISAIELRIPDGAAVDTDVELSAAEFRVPDATDVEISAIELRIPDAQTDVEISAMEFRIPDFGQLELTMRLRKGRSWRSTIDQKGRFGGTGLGSQ